MTVVPFSVARFTPADLVELYRIILPDCALGFLSGIVRETGAKSDRLVLSTRGEPAYTLERDGSGKYHLYQHGPHGAGCIASAGSVRECLAGWRIRQRGPDRRPVMPPTDRGSAPGRW